MTVTLADIFFLLIGLCSLVSGPIFALVLGGALQRARRSDKVVYTAVLFALCLPYLWFGLRESINPIIRSSYAAAPSPPLPRAVTITLVSITIAALMGLLASALVVVLTRSMRVARQALIGLALGVAATACLSLYVRGQNSMIFSAWMGAIIWLFCAHRGLRAWSFAELAAQHRHCRACNYSLTGLPSSTTRCPECGADFNQHTAARE